MGAGVAIHPLHQSVRQQVHAGRRFVPRNMDRLPMPVESVDALHQIAMSIFADCTNVGVPFQEAIAAVYLSGLQHGAALSKES